MSYGDMRRIPVQSIAALLFSLEGRVRRRDVWLAFLLLGLGVLLLVMALAGWLGGRWTSFVATAVVAWPVVAIVGKRLQDRGRRAWPWLLVYFGPVIVLTILQQLELGYWWRGGIAFPSGYLPNLLSFLSLGTSAVGLLDAALMPGENGPNRFGPDPRVPASVSKLR